MFDKTIKIRLSSEDIEDIGKAAKQAGVSPTAITRIYIREGLARFDRKHQELLENQVDLMRLVESLRHDLEESLKLGAMNYAALAMLKGNRHDGETRADQHLVDDQIHAPALMGAAIRDMSRSGELYEIWQEKAKLS